MEERRAFQRALAARSGAEPMSAAAGGSATGFSAGAEGGSLEAPLSLQLKLVESAEMGQDLHLRLLARNKEAAPKEVKLSLSAQPVLHDGSPRPPFWRDSHYLALGPAEGERPAGRREGGAGSTRAPSPPS